MPEAYKGKNLSYYSYIMGEGYDKVEKTPEWAAKITGIPAERIEELAEEIGTTKPLYVNQGWGPQRRSNGEWTAWAIMALPCLVGQIGLPGTNNGTREDRTSPASVSMDAGKNPVKTKKSLHLFLPKPLFLPAPEYLYFHTKMPLAVRILQTKPSPDRPAEAVPSPDGQSHGGCR